MRAGEGARFVSLVDYIIPGLGTIKAGFGTATAALKLADRVVKKQADKQLIEAGEAKAISEGLKNAMDRIDKARETARYIRRNPDSDYARRVRESYTRTDDG